ncbi:unnamed protein product [Brassica napus]|uniref:Uncharacterized protein n=2 Tax=Brassica TaxID=3705 RepID=A0A3P6F9Q5_BRAOL|nr:unnamed protein product [Brassica napus]VDD39929.1 unnamed protein product [Brassica oleracea]
MSCKARRRQKLKHIPSLRLKLAVAVTITMEVEDVGEEESYTSIFLIVLILFNFFFLIHFNKDKQITYLIFISIQDFLGFGRFFFGLLVYNRF